MIYRGSFKGSFQGSIGGPLRSHLRFGVRFGVQLQTFTFQGFESRVQDFGILIRFFTVLDRFSEVFLLWGGDCTQVS